MQQNEPLLLYICRQTDSVLRIFEITDWKQHLVGLLGCIYLNTAAHYYIYDTVMHTLVASNSYIMASVIFLFT